MFLNSFGGDGELVSASPEQVVINLGQKLSGGETGLNLTSYYSITVTQPTEPGAYIQNLTEQQDILNLDINSQGQPGSPVYSYNFLVSTSLILDLQISHGLSLDSLTQSPININEVGQEIYYKIEVTNKSNSPMFNIEVYNNFQNNMKVQTISSTTPTESFSLVRSLGGSTMDGIIPVLNEGETVTIIFICKVLEPIVPGQRVKNNVSSYFSTSTEDLYGVQFGIVKSNILEYIVPPDIVKINLVPSSSTIDIGNVLTYNLQIVIPEGLQLFNCMVNDFLPIGQQYLNDISPTTMIANYSGDNTEEVKLLQQPIVDTVTGKKILNYKYNVMINQPQELTMLEKGKTLQTNKVVMNWNDSANATNNLQIEASCIVNIIQPYISIEALQEVLNSENVFYTGKAEVKPLDYLNFRINIENLGAAPAYNIKVNCNLANSVKYIENITIKYGDLTVNTDTNIVIWSIPKSNIGQVMSATFKVQMQEGVPAAYVCQNITNASFTTSSLQDSKQYSVKGNILEEQYPEILITKTAMPTSPTVGNKIKYTLNVEVYFII